MNSTIWLALALVLVLEASARSLSARMAPDDRDNEPTPGQYFASFWRWSCGCRYRYLLHVEENDWLIKN